MSGSNEEKIEMENDEDGDADEEKESETYSYVLYYKMVGQQFSTRKPNGIERLAY